MRSLQRAGHLRRDALAHLRHRQQHLIRPVRERDGGTDRASIGRPGRCRGRRGAGGRGPWLGGSGPLTRGAWCRCGRDRTAGPDRLDHGEDVVTGDVRHRSRRPAQLSPCSRAADARPGSCARRDRRAPWAAPSQPMRPVVPLRAEWSQGSSRRAGRPSGHRRLRRASGANAACSALTAGSSGFAAAGVADFASTGAEAPFVEPSSAVSMTAISALFGTVAPSSARISFRTPSNGDGPLH